MKWRIAVRRPIRVTISLRWADWSERITGKVPLVLKARPQPPHLWSIRSLCFADTVSPAIPQRGHVKSFVSENLLDQPSERTRVTLPTGSSGPPCLCFAQICMWARDNGQKAKHRLTISRDMRVWSESPVWRSTNARDETFVTTFCLDPSIA
jgi:hypothetical protein